MMNLNIDDHARTDGFTALVVRIAVEEQIDMVPVCVRRIEPAWVDDLDGESFPAKVVYECRQRAAGKLTRTLTFDTPSIGDDEASVAESVRIELNAVFG